MASPKATDPSQLLQVGALWGLPPPETPDHPGIPRPTWSCTPAGCQRDPPARPSGADGRSPRIFA